MRTLKKKSTPVSACRAGANPIPPTSRAPSRCHGQSHHSPGLAGTAVRRNSSTRPLDSHFVHAF